MDIIWEKSAWSIGNRLNVHCATFDDQTCAIFFRSHLNVRHKIVKWTFIIKRSRIDRWLIDRRSFNNERAFDDQTFKHLQKKIIWSIVERSAVNVRFKRLTIDRVQSFSTAVWTFDTNREMIIWCSRSISHVRSSIVLWSIMFWVGTKYQVTDKGVNLHLLAYYLINWCDYLWLLYVH